MSLLEFARSLGGCMYFMQIWVDFDFNEYVLMLEKCLLMQMRVNIWVCFRGREGERELKEEEEDTGSGDEENYHYFSRKIFFFNLMRGAHITATHVWLTWHFMLSVRLPMEKLLHSPIFSIPFSHDFMTKVFALLSKNIFN